MKTLLNNKRLTLAMALIFIFALLLITGRVFAVEIQGTQGPLHTITNQGPVNPAISQHLANTNTIYGTQTPNAGIVPNNVKIYGTQLPINNNNVLPAGVQGLQYGPAKSGAGFGVLALEGLGYLFVVKLITLHFNLN